MGKRSELKQQSTSSGCLSCVDTSHYRRDCDVDSGDDSIKQRADEFWKVKKASDRRKGKDRMIFKSNAISEVTPADNLIH